MTHIQMKKSIQKMVTKVNKNALSAAPNSKVTYSWKMKGKIKDNNVKYF